MATLRPQSDGESYHWTNSCIDLREEPTSQPLSSACPYTQWEFQNVFELRSADAILTISEPCSVIVHIPSEKTVSSTVHDLPHPEISQNLHISLKLRPAGERLQRLDAAPPTTQHKDAEPSPSPRSGFKISDLKEVFETGTAGVGFAKEAFKFTKQINEWKQSRKPVSKSVKQASQPARPQNHTHRIRGASVSHVDHSQSSHLKPQEPKPRHRSHSHSPHRAYPAYNHQYQQPLQPTRPDQSQVRNHHESVGAASRVDNSRANHLDPQNLTSASRSRSQSPNLVDPRYHAGSNQYHERGRQHPDDIIVQEFRPLAAENYEVKRPDFSRVDKVNKGIPKKAPQNQEHVYNSQHPTLHTQHIESVPAPEVFAPARSDYRHHQEPIRTQPQFRTQEEYQRRPAPAVHVENKVGADHQHDQNPPTKTQFSVNPSTQRYNPHSHPGFPPPPPMPAPHHREQFRPSPNAQPPKPLQGHLLYQPTMNLQQIQHNHENFHPTADLQQFRSHNEKIHPQLHQIDPQKIHIHPKPAQHILSHQRQDTNLHQLNQKPGKFNLHAQANFANGGFLHPMFQPKQYKEQKPLQHSNSHSSRGDRGREGIHRATSLSGRREANIKPKKGVGRPQSLPPSSSRKGMGGIFRF